jgi:hypothetical protein
MMMMVTNMISNDSSVTHVHAPRQICVLQGIPLVKYGMLVHPGFGGADYHGLPVRDSRRGRCALTIRAIRTLAMRAIHVDERTRVQW